MARVKEETVYQFDELSDRAKETARNWIRQAEAQDFDAECTLDDAATIAGLLGISLETRTVKLMGGGSRQEPVIYYSGFSSQGDGACFEGSYSYAKGSVATIKAHAPLDTELHRIAEGLRDAQRPHFYRLQASIKHTGHYYHSHSVSIEVEDSNDTYRDIGEASEEIADLLRDYMQWIYKQLEKEYEYRLSDEVIDDTIRANEYEFDSDGRLA